MKITNDTLGHPAGDTRLRAPAEAVRAGFRSYDLLIRIGGDEFVCGLPDMTAAAADDRSALVNVLLTTAGHLPVTIGLAELRADDTVEALVARADTAMYEQRHPCPRTYALADRRVSAGGCHVPSAMAPTVRPTHGERTP